MGFFGKATSLLFGLAMAGVAGLLIFNMLDWPRETTGQLALLFVAAPAAILFGLSGLYIAYRGLTSGRTYVSPTGTGETG